MNFLWLDDIVALAAHRSFTRAAEVRHMTQPAFSRRIHALEQWLGTRLVDRNRQPIEMTGAGRWMVGIATETLARVARMPDEARAVAGAKAATIRIAATHALSLTFLPAWLRGFDDRILAAPIELVSDVLERCEDAMFDARVQFLLGHAHPDVGGRLDRRFDAKTVGRDTLLPVCAPRAGRDGAARHRFVVGASAGRVPVLAFSNESGLGRIVATLRGTAIAKAAGTTVFTADLATVLRSMALEGRGVAWLPRNLIADDLRARRLVAAAPPSWRIALDIRIYRSDAARTPAADALWSAVTTLAR